jgi:hypothetical protein
MKALPFESPQKGYKKMKSTFVILTFLAMALPCQATPNKGDIGVGVILGDPVFITAKKWLGRTTAIDGAFSLKDGGNKASGSAYELNVNYLKHDFGIFPVNDGALPLYYGVGIKLEDDREFEASLRVPVGVSYLFDDAPFSVFFEYALLLDLTSSSPTLNSETAFGVRYYF